MKKYDSEYIKLNPNQFYTCRNGEKYPYLKDDIEKEIDYFRPSTFLSILKDMDFPFIEREWFYNLKYIITHSTNSKRRCFGTYIAKMKLCSFKMYTFKDSEKLCSYPLNKYKDINYIVNKGVFYMTNRIKTNGVCAECIHFSVCKHEIKKQDLISKLSKTEEDLKPFEILIKCPNFKK